MMVGLRSCAHLFIAYCPGLAHWTDEGSETEVQARRTRYWHIGALSTFNLIEPLLSCLLHTPALQNRFRSSH